MSLNLKGHLAAIINEEKSLELEELVKHSLNECLKEERNERKESHVQQIKRLIERKQTIR